MYSTSKMDYICRHFLRAVRFLAGCPPFLPLTPTPLKGCLKTPVPKFHHSPSPCEGVAEERSDADGVVSSVVNSECVSDDATPRQASPATPLCSKEGNGWREHTEFSNSL